MLVNLAHEDKKARIKYKIIKISFRVRGQVITL